MDTWQVDLEQIAGRRVGKGDFATSCVAAVPSPYRLCTFPCSSDHIISRFRLAHAKNRLPPVSSALAPYSTPSAVGKRGFDGRYTFRITRLGSVLPTAQPYGPVWGSTELGRFYIRDDFTD